MQKSCFLKNYIWNLQVRRSSLNFFGNFCRCFHGEKIRQKCFPPPPTFQSTVQVKTGARTDVTSHQDQVRHLRLSSVQFATCLVGLSE